MSNNPSKTAKIKNCQATILDLHAHLMTVAARYRNRTLSKAAIHSAIHELLADIVRRYAVAPLIIIVRTVKSFRTAKPL